MPNPYLDTELPSAPGAGQPAAAAKNPYLDTELDPGGERQRMRTAVFAAGDVAPEVAVRARKLAERTGMAPDVVERNLPIAEKQARVEDVNRHTDDAPTLRAAYSDHYFAQIAGKESGTLAKIEKAVRSYMDPQGERSKGLKGGKVVLTPSEFSDRVHKIKESNPALDWATATQLASQGVAFDNSPGGIRESQRPVTNAVNLLTGVGVRLYEGLRQFGSNVQLIDANLHGKDRTEQTRRELIQSENRTFLRAAQPDGYAANQLYQGFVGVVAQLPGIIATGPTDSVAPLLTAFFASSGASGYSDVKLRGGSNSEAALNGLIQGGLEAGTELLPLSFAVRNFERLGVGKVFAEFTGKELLSEMLNTVASKAADTAIANPNKSWADYRDELPQALMDTTLQVLATAGTLGVISKGMSVVGAHAVRREQDIQQANERAAMLGDLFNVAAGANVKKLDAATFGDFVQKVAESTGSDLAQVHVDAAILADTLKQSGIDMDVFAQMSPDAAKELTEALQSGGSVAIPIGDLVGKMGDTGLEQALLPHLRATEDGLSLEEAKVEQEMAQEFLAQESSRVMQQAADFHATEQSAEAVRSNIFGQLQATGRFSADVNKAYSTLVGSFYTVLGNNLGVTPEQAYAQFPLRVQGVGVEQEGYKQPEDVADATTSDFTQEALPELLSKGNWAILTAADPGATKQSDEANAAAMAALRQDLDDIGVTYTEAVGKYGDVQPSFIITGIPERVAQALGNKYGQESILTRKGLIYQDGSITPATGIDVFNEAPEDFYTEVPDTGAFFSVQLDFDTRVQPEGSYAQSLSARVPNAAGSVNDINVVNTSDLAALQMAPTLLAKIATRLGGAASLLTRRLKDPDALLDAYIDQMVDNLVWLHDQVPAEIRERSKLWYDGARALVDRVVARYGDRYTAAQVSGVYAVMSPQMDWFQNVTLGDRIVDIWSAQQDSPWTPEMDTAIRATAAAGSPEVLAAIDGKTLAQLETDEHRAYWIAAYDLAYNTRDFHVVTPEGGFADLSRNNDGRPMRVSWANGFGPIAKAVSILRDGSLENISAMLGAKHKVRNFYNNIFDPNSSLGFVTSDTHAVSAALLLPLSGESPEVKDNFGSAGQHAATGIFGSYPVYVEAYKRAAARVSERDGVQVLPREMQSITWEALRGLFTPSFKGKYNSKKDATFRAEFDNIWKDYHAGRTDANTARERVLALAGGITPPDWYGPDTARTGQRWSASYAGELLAPGGVAGAVDSGTGSDAAGRAGVSGSTQAVEDTATQVEQRRMRQAVDLAVLQAKPSKSDSLAQTAAGEKPGQIALTGVHFSTKPGLNRVDGRFYGTGLKGAEKERIRNGTDSRLAARTYFYVDEGKGVRPEAGVGGNAHEAQLSNLYDINADPLKLIVGGNTNATESNILDAGFDGYYVRDAFNQQGAAVVIGPASYSIPVAPIANPTTKAPPLPPAAPAVYKRGLMSSELNKINIDAIKVVAPSARISAGNFQVLQSEAQAAAAVAAMQGINLPVEYAQGEGTRGTFSPKNLTITLLENADLTTFLHETGHFMLEAMASVTSRVDAPVGMREDMGTLLKWFGVDDINSWNNLDTNGKRPYHEKFAESFEQYLFEGKAPSVELQGVFRRFRSWMQNVYRSLADFMRSHNTQLSDEVRQVFDRMLATDEAITQAEDAAGMFTDPDATAMAMEKLTARSLRDLKWTINARAKAIKKLQHQAAQLRTAVKAEVQAEVDDMPVFRARDALAALKTDAEHGIDTLPQEEAIAAANGYTGVDHMLHDVLRAGGKAATVEAMVDNRMLERYGDLIDQRAIEKAANEEVHNEARARSLATELAAQTAALNAREDTGKTNAAGSRMTVNVLMKAAKHFASNIIGRTTVRELPGRIRQHLAAERRAGKAWQKATAAGATQDAIRAKKDQVLNNAAAREAMLASEEVAKTIDYFKKFDKDTVRAKLPQEYLDQIDRLLEAIDLRKSTTNREIDRRQSLREWVESQHQLGIDPVLPDYLLDGMRQTSYKELTVDEVRGLKDTIKNIEHLGRLKGKLLKARDQREFDAIVDELAASIREHGGKELPVQLEPDGKVKQFFKGAWADHRKLNSLIHQMDGGKDNGPFYRALVRSMNDSGTQESVMLEQATMALADIFKPVEALPGGLAGGEVFIPEINNTLTRSGRLSIALNWGNTQNRQRVTGGDGWTTMQVEAILRTLSRTELDFVNKVWEHIDSYWPAIKEKQLRVSGVVEDKVEAEPFEVTLPDGSVVQMRGGYYPIKYDSDRSIRAEKNEAAEKAMDILRGAFMRPTTRRGHLKARVDEVNGRPLRKDLSALTQHISQAVHDLSWHEWFIDANRLMNDSRIQSAIRDHYGPQTARAMRDAINAIAVGDAVHQGQIDQLLLRMRSNVTRSIMGASLTTALLQPFGLTQSMARIGVVPVLKGAARWAGDAMHMESTVGWINEKSDFMRLRNKTFNRELREINQRLHGKSTFMRIVDASLFMAMQKMQMVADVPTWVGMYEKALAGGVDEGAAIALADEAVLASQGGGTIKDLSAVQRDMPFLTQFYSYFNTTMQLVAEKTALTDFKNPRAVAGWLGDMALLTVIPSILPAMITHLLKGGGDAPGDDDPWKWVKRFLGWYSGYMFGMFVGLRELPAVWSPFDYGGPPAAKLINDGRRLVQQAEQGEIDDKAVLAVIGFMGTAIGLPTSQLIRSYKGWQAWDEGKAPPTAMLFGPPPKE